MEPHINHILQEQDLTPYATQGYLERLPEEMVVRILLFCDHKDVIQFSSTSRHFRNVVSTSARLQLYIELQANGLQLTDYALGDSWDLPTLRDALERHRNAWLDLDITSSIDKHCGDEIMYLWELRDDMFAKAFSHNDDHSEPNSLLLIPLKANGDQTLLSFGVTFSEFTMDPSQELILLAGLDTQSSTYGWLRLCSSATGLAHPLAQHPTLTVDLGFPVDTRTPSNITLEIKGQIIAAKFAGSGQHKYEILICNWQKGILLGRISSSIGIANFVFLNSLQLAVWSACETGTGHSLTQASLIVYELGSAGLGSPIPSNRVFDVSGFLQLAPSYVFQFPKLRGSSRVISGGFLLRSDYGSQESGLSMTVPFTNKGALTLGLTMTLIDGSFVHPLRIFVDTSRLTRHMSEMRRAGTQNLDWKNWGEYTTRWFQTESPDSWICWMFGSRYVVGDDFLSVLDFNTSTVRRFQHRQMNNSIFIENEGDMRFERTARIQAGTWLNGSERSKFISNLYSSNEDAVVVDTVMADTPTCLRYFDEPVTSRLPYRIVTKARPAEPHEGWLISGNYLIGMGFDFGFASSSNEMTVYTIG